ncbi:Drug resistance transporter Bcr/CflA subfamily precursor [gamma proteobacterium HdN1]|nr:Drug resistance transporter Bcr/CflA subfamily precursor [gamma proteobacterium HdN1]
MDYPPVPASPSWLLLLGCLIALGPLAIDMYLPAFPAIEAELGSGAQLTLSGFFAGLVIGQLVYGPISDRVGRRRPILVGTVIYTLASLASTQVTSLEALAALRFLQALGACAGMVLTRAIVRDCCKVRAAAQAQSRLMLVMGLAPILAPTLGGWLLQHAEWRAIFMAQGIAGALIGLACLFSLNESLPPEKRHHTLSIPQITHNFGALLRHRYYMGCTLSSGLTLTGMFAYIAGSPAVLITQYGLSPQEFAVFFGVNAAGFIVTSQVNAWLLKRHHMLPILNRSLWVPMLASLAALTANHYQALSFPLFAVLLFMFIASLGFIVPNASAMGLDTQKQQVGAAASLQGALQFLLAAVAATLLSQWQTHDALPLTLVMSVASVSAFLANRWMLSTATEATWRLDGD